MIDMIYMPYNLHVVLTYENVFLFPYKKKKYMSQYLYMKKNANPDVQIWSEKVEP